ncbi:MAG TPA: hypothetical protein VFA76_17760 [Terriglobales bacterium]|nr:hypothetical protein [Terriglobales bacterium]
MLRISTEERFAVLIATGGIVWSVRTATQDPSSLTQFSLLNPGPLEICAIGILIWLHAKWRSLTKVG